MGYLGLTPTTAQQNYLNIDDISGSFNGTTTSFALQVGSVAPTPFPVTNSCLISVGGVIQEPDDTGTSGFRISGGNIVFSSAPGTGEDFFGLILAGADYLNIGANFPDGTVGTPSITFDSDTNTGIYHPSADELSFVTGGSDRVRVDSNGRLGIGTTSPNVPLTLESDSSASFAIRAASDTTLRLHLGYDYTNDYARIGSEDVGVNQKDLFQHAMNHRWGRNNSIEYMRLDSEGRLLVGTTTARTNFDNGSITSNLFQIERTASGGNAALSVCANATDAAVGAVLYMGRTRATADGGTTVVQSQDLLGRLTFQGADGSEIVEAASITAEVDATPGANDMPGRLVFSTTADGASSPTERVVIDNAGRTNLSTAAQAGSFTRSASLRVLSGVITQNADFEMGNTGYTSTMIHVACERTQSGSYNFIDLFSGRRYDNSAGDRETSLQGDGNNYCDGSWNGGGADYAEMFEWSDANSAAEDRRGLSVVLDGDKIREAVGGEDPIGVISGNPSVVGDAAWNKWNEKYLTDDFGSYQKETYSLTEWQDENGETQSYESDRIPADVTVPDNAVIKTVDDAGATLTRRVLNPSYDPDVVYVPRKERPEWDCVGLMGKLRIRKGQVIGARWIKMRDISENVEEWLVR